jgi:hypothetical protein
VWKREVDGRVLTFRLAGINNQNFLMRDEETGSFWQQISGKAISGPLRGKQLELIHCDELTFALWRQENPSGTVLRPVDSFAKKYAPKDWDVRMLKQKTVVDTSKSGMKPRELMLGVTVNGKARAYPMDRVLSEKLILDRVGATPVLVVVGPDGKSIRVFEATAAGADFFRDANPSQDNAILTESATGSRWTFHGCAVSGEANGQCLKPVTALKDYWFDWQLYHPDTTVFRK